MINLPEVGLKCFYQKRVSSLKLTAVTADSLGNSPGERGVSATVSKKLNSTRT